MSDQEHKDERKEIEVEFGDDAKEPATDAPREEAETEARETEAPNAEEEIAMLKDRLLRQAAEFENYKRRSVADQERLLNYAAEPFIAKLLPVIDDFERSLTHMENAKDIDAVRRGVTMVYEKLMKTLAEQGVERIDSVGKPFDVDYHEALMRQPDPDVEPYTVLQEVEPGYQYKDRVMRHAKVIVSERPAESDDKANPNEA
jgi:molecular chaperone GrpE